MTRPWALAILLTLSGCASVAPPVTPVASGLMWAFRMESETMPSLKAVGYAPERSTCEGQRAVALKPPAGAAYAAIRVTTDCYRAIVGSGSEFWVYPTGESFVGATDKEWCMKLRQGSKNIGVSVGACQPVAIRSMP